MSAFTTKKSIKIDLDIGDQLTYISCGHIIVEIIKYIAYQRLQIPYTYQWLKQVVDKRKSQEDIRESHHSERHFFTASTALSNLDFIIKVGCCTIFKRKLSRFNFCGLFITH